MIETDYALVIVFSNWTLSKIFDFLKDYLDSKDNEIALTNIERFKDKRTGIFRDSNRTLILMKRNLYKKATDSGLDMPQPNLDFRIAEYILKEKNFPAKYYSSNLYMIIPKNIDVAEIELIISEKFKKLVEFNLLKPNDFQMKIPLESRFTGEHRGFVYIEFLNDIDLRIKAMIKLILHDSFMYLESLDKLYHLPVLWAKDMKSNDKVYPKINRILKRGESLNDEYLSI